MLYNTLGMLLRHRLWQMGVLLRHRAVLLLLLLWLLVCLFHEPVAFTQRQLRQGLSCCSLLCGCVVIPGPCRRRR